MDVKSTEHFFMMIDLENLGVPIEKATEVADLVVSGDLGWPIKVRNTLDSTDYTLFLQPKGTWSVGAKRTSPTREYVQIYPYRDVI